MPLLIFSAILASLFAVLGVLSWFLLYLLKRRNHGARVFRVTLTAFLLLFPVFLFAVLPLTFSHLVANASTRPQDRILTETPASFDCEYSEVEFPSRDGLLLKGWLIKGDPAKSPIVFSHGLFRSRREVLERACSLSRQGHSVLVFDLRCHGQSQKKTISLGHNERFDVLGAKDFLTRSHGDAQIVFAGVSMGAVASIMAVHESAESVKAIIADSPFDNLVATVGRHTRIFLGLPAQPFSSMFIWNLTRKANFQADHLDTVSAFSSLKNVPVLLIYGEDDPRMTGEVARKLFEAIPYPRKQLIFFENAGHGASFDSAPRRYVDSIVSFLRK